MSKSNPFSFPKHIILPFVVGLLPIGAAFFINARTTQSITVNIQNTLETKSEQVTNRIQQKTTNFVLLIDELTDFPTQKKGHTNNDWYNLVSSLNLTTSLPEIKHIGILQYNKENESLSQIHTYQNSINNIESYDDIFKQIKNLPQYEQIKLFHKQDIQRSITSGTTFSSVSSDPDLGILYFPIVKPLLRSDNLNDNNTNIEIIAFIYINISEFFEISLTRHPDVNFSILRSTSKHGLIPLHYDRKNAARVPLFRYKTTMDAFDEDWVLNFYSEPALESELKQNRAWLIYSFGIIVGILMFAVFYLITSGRNRAIKLAEQMTSSLRKSEQDFRLAFDNTNSGIASLGLDMMFQTSNLKFQTITGYSKEEVHGLHFSAVMDYTKEDKIAQEKARLGTQETLFFTNKRILKCKNGEKIWIRFGAAMIKDKKGKPFTYILNIDDITEELKSQQKILESEKRLSLAMDTFQMSVWDWSPKSNMMHWDDKGLGIFGLPVEADTTVDINELMPFIHPDDHKIIEDGMRHAAETKTEYEHPFRIIRPDKTIRTLKSKMSPIPHSKELKFIGVTTDITEENKLAQLKANFVSVASHQLRTPLTAIRWFQQIITDNVDTEPLSEKQTKYIKKMEESSTRMLNLVNDLLQVSRLDNKSIELNPIELSLCDSTQDMIEQLYMQAKEKKMKFDFACPIKNAMVMADKTFTEQVIQNLCSNAIKYGGGADKDVKIRISENAKMIKWEITDEGIGLTEEDKGKLFQQFFRSKEASESKADGSGLGLYIAKAIIEQSGGQMDYTSKHGVGSTFWFTLPKITAATQKAAAKKEAGKIAEEAARAKEEELKVIEAGKDVTDNKEEKNTEPTPEKEVLASKPVVQEITKSTTKDNSQKKKTIKKTTVAKK